MQLKSKDLDASERQRLESELEHNKDQLTKAIKAIESVPPLDQSDDEDEQMLDANEDRTLFDEEQILKIYSLKLRDHTNGLDEMDASPIDQF